MSDQDPWDMPLPTSYDPVDDWGSEWNDTPSNVDNPFIQDQQKIIEKTPRLHSRLVRRVGGLAAGAVLIGGAAFGISQSIDNDTGSQPSADKGSSAVAFDAYNQPTELGPGIVADIEKAVSADKCSTKVTPEEVEGFYARLFGERELPSSIEELQAQATVTEERLSAAREKVSPMSLSNEQQAFLQTEEDGNYTASYDTYKRHFTNYLSENGLKFTDSWSNDTTLGSSVTGDQLSSTIRPMSVGELANSPASKVQIALAMRTLSNIPGEVVQVAGLKEVIIGDLTVDAAGVAPMSTDIFMLDAQNPKIQSLDDALQRYKGTTTSHEISHLIDSQMCVALFGGYVSDPGYTSLNRDFTYGTKSEMTLANGQLVGNTYTDLLSGTPGEAVVARSYGALHEAEDKGTLLGEHVINTAGAEQLFGATDATIVHEKVSLLLARMAKINPDVADYYVQVLQAAQVIDTAKSLAEPLQANLYDIREKLLDNGVIDFEQDSEYAKAASQLESYDDAVKGLTKYIQNTD